MRQVQANTMEPPSGEIDAINVHSAVRAEVRQAVAEALHELEQVCAGYFVCFLNMIYFRIAGTSLVMNSAFAAEYPLPVCVRF